MKLEYDLKKLYMDALAPQPGEVVTFLNDFPPDASQADEATDHRREMVIAWHAKMVELASEVGFEVKPIVHLDIRNPAPAGFDVDGYVDGKSIDLAAVMNGWGEKDVIIAITGPSITAALIGHLGQNFRFASAPGVSADFEGFKADYSRIPLRFEILVQKMARAVAVDMVFRLDGLIWKFTMDVRGNRYQFNENGCARRPGDFMNLPSGCANIPPYPGIEGDVRGKSLTEGEIPAIIDEELVIYRIRENRIVEISGNGDAAAKERKSILESGDSGMAVLTKLGLGVNDEGRCNGTHVGDEKTMGMHWGYGPAKHFPDTIWAEHPIQMDLDFVYHDGSCEPIFRNSMYAPQLGDLF